MRIAFYAPMKPPGHPVPSGDREMARLLIRALTHAGFQVEVASRLRSFDARGVGERQVRLQRLGHRLAERLVDRYRQRPPEARPRLWFTYHLYHKAPDWLGPVVSGSLGIPYVIAEASHAPKQCGGPWANGHIAAQAAIRQADLIVGLNSADAQCVLPLLASPSRLLGLRPFMDVNALQAELGDRALERQRLATEYGFQAAEPLLMTVAMMRPGAKLASYRLLAQSLVRLAFRPWRILVVGDGPARGDVLEGFAPFRNRVVWLGQRAPYDIRRILPAVDLFVWPAVDEAYGMALLEAQAAGLPCVAGRSGGVPDVVIHDKTGLLVPPDQPDALAAAVSQLLDDPVSRQAFGRAARQNAAQHHGMDAASAVLGEALHALIGTQTSAR